MVNPDFSPTPLYQEIQREAAGNTTVEPPGDYEETKPAVQQNDDGKVTNNWTLQMDSRASGKAYLVTNRTNATLLIRFLGSGIRLKTLKAPSGGIAFVTL